MCSSFNDFGTSTLCVSLAAVYVGDVIAGLLLDAPGRAERTSSLHFLDRRGIHPNTLQVTATVFGIRHFEFKRLQRTILWEERKKIHPVRKCNSIR